jgi:hypothetical protein
LVDGGGMTVPDASIKVCAIWDIGFAQNPSLPDLRSGWLPVGGRAFGAFPLLLSFSRSWQDYHSQEKQNSPGHTYPGFPLEGHQFLFH